MDAKKPPLIDDRSITLPSFGTCHTCGAPKFGRTVYCSPCLLAELEFAAVITTLRPTHGARLDLLDLIPLRVRIAAYIRRSIDTYKGKTR